MKNGVFPKWSRTFIELSELGEFRESNRSLKHELGSVYNILSLMCILLAWWYHSGLLHKRWQVQALLL